MSTLDIHCQGRIFRVDSAKGHDLSIPIGFGGDGITAFGFSPASVERVKKGWFIGNTRRGGGNVREYRCIPHCHGTHTECVGYITDQEISVGEILKDAWIPATVISVVLELGVDCSENYVSGMDADDALITRTNLIGRLERLEDKTFHQALIIRTLPNSLAKRTRHYAAAPYFSNDAMAEIVRRGVRHLLVDLPSIDRMEDLGSLSNHYLFWELPPASRDLNQCKASFRTITEFLFVPDVVLDGYYLLNLQIAPFIGDAAPSRPLLFAVEEL